MGDAKLVTYDSLTAGAAAAGANDVSGMFVMAKEALKVTAFLFFSDSCATPHNAKARCFSVIIYVTVIGGIRAFCSGCFPALDSSS